MDGLLIACEGIKWTKHLDRSVHVLMWNLILYFSMVQILESSNSRLIAYCTVVAHLKKSLVGNRSTSQIKNRTLLHDALYILPTEKKSPMSIIPISFLTSIKRTAMHEQSCYHKMEISYELHIWKSICVPFAAKILPRHIKCLHHHRHHLLHHHNHLHLHQLLLFLVNTMLNNSMLNRTRG